MIIGQLYEGWFWYIQKTEHNKTRPQRKNRRAIRHTVQESNYVGLVKRPNVPFNKRGGVVLEGHDIFIKPLKKINIGVEKGGNKGLLLEC